MAGVGVRAGAGLIGGVAGRRLPAWVVAARYVLRVLRWRIVAAGAALGGVAIALSHVVEAGPFASPHLGVGLGVLGVATGAAFAFDDAAATTLAAVPTSLRRRTLVRAALAVVLAAAAVVALVVLAWESLGYAAVAGQAAGLVALGLAGAAVAGRVVGWQGPGVVGAATIAVFAVADAIGVAPGEAPLLTGGAPVAGAGAWVWAVVGGAAARGLLWGTRDPAGPTASPGRA